MFTVKAPLTTFLPRRNGPREKREYCEKQSTGVNVLFLLCVEPHMTFNIILTRAFRECIPMLSHVIMSKWEMHNYFGYSDSDLDYSEN